MSALQVPHAAVRAYVMGDRAPALEPATAEETEEMARLVVEALDAGALGFSTSRTLKHRDKHGASTPTLKAEAEELHGIARAMGKAGKGVLQLIADFKDTDAEFAMLRGMVEISGRPHVDHHRAGRPLADRLEACARQYRRRQCRRSCRSRVKCRRARRASCSASRPRSIPSSCTRPSARSGAHRSNAGEGAERPRVPREAPRRGTGISGGRDHRDDLHRLSQDVRAGRGAELRTCARRKA